MILKKVYLNYTSERVCAVTIRYNRNDLLVSLVKVQIQIIVSDFHADFKNDIKSGPSV